jgi:dihydrolipoamide dehydrogenase
VRPETNVDIAVIGGGPGGYVAAIRAAQLGARVVLFEQARVGGVCLNVGCIPTKALAATAETLAAVKTGGARGITGTVGMDLALALDHKNRVVQTMVEGVEHLLEANGVILVRARARLVDRLSVSAEVDGESHRFTASRGVILSPGSVTAPAPFPVADVAGVLDSTAALDLGSLPERIVIIGGGVIGAEFASIWSAFGAKVTILEYLPNLLPGLDTDLGRRLQLAFRRAGVTTHTRTQVRGVEEGEPLRVLAAGPGGDLRLDADAVLVATGRRPALNGLGLQGAGVALRNGAIGVGERLETNVPGVYAVGDATGGLMLAHRAMAQGRMAAENALGAQRQWSDAAVPVCVFTHPEVASVGLTLTDARARGVAAEERSFPFSGNGRATAADEGFGEVKLVYEPGSRRVLGMHVVGPHASDLISEGALAVRLGLTADDLADTVHAHPTYGEAVLEAALGATSGMIHFLDRRRRETAP